MNENQNLVQTMNECQEKVNTLETNLKNVLDAFNKMLKHLNTENEHFNKIVEEAKKYSLPHSQIVKFNVGGKIFSTLKSTIEHKIMNTENGSYYDPNLFQLLISGILKPVLDDDKSIFIDRDPHYYRYIFDYLRAMTTLEEYKPPNFTGNELDEFKREIEFCKVYGLLDQLNGMFSDSKILTKELSKQLNKLCEFENSKWKLLYRGTLHGFQGANFHGLCDGAANTLTVVKTTNGYIFGGYSPTAWDSSGNYKSGQNSFIFSLINHENKPIKIPFTQNNGIYCNQGYLATFGGGHDFYITPNANTNTSSYSNLGHSYLSQNHPYTSNQAKNLLAGSYNFQIQDIEVFQKL